MVNLFQDKTAIKVNIQIIRVFTKIRQIFTDNLSLKLEIEEIKKSYHIKIKILNSFLAI